MKKIPFYRRVNGANAGMKEKIAWQLSKRPMTGAELSEILKIPLTEITSAMGAMMKQTRVICVTGSPVFIRDDGLTDRLYSLESRPKRVAPSPAVNIPISKKSLQCMLNGEKEKNTLAAKRRRKFIKAGTYCDSMN